MWALDYDGHHIGTIANTSVIEKYEGEQEKFSEIVKDSEFNGSLDESVKDLVELGEKCYSLLFKNCQYYKGTTAEFPHHQRDLFATYHGIIPEIDEPLTPHQYFLLPFKVWAFIFKTRTWEQMKVESFREPIYQQSMIDNLVMDASRIKTLKALAGSYIRQDIHGEKLKHNPWNADFVQGKGQGKIILLHGKPGVGKTCTAEYIAEYTKRPLMVLTSSDIGAIPEKIEIILSDGFKTAASWGAVLLIDEADVFMERRSSNDLNRNCLVAGFLRALEFYDGILFLTTNRVGAFGDAFISRINVKLYYKDFTDDERQRVWKTFIDKLIKDRGSTIRISMDAKDFIAGKAMKELKWNGREIRNLLLSDTHLRSIVDMSRDFKEYLDRAHGADEEKRAAIDGSRLDDRSY
ncbi:P-loop containing nucleoside triphosphate hydrolase protein [Amylocarpus encephaloides]|uniref:P-loop containing nucleoside triphosphate hydrolase protein n=1 Tax=Amylocarpus encephaloides TaxID=45428 RepID=A0A9P7Y8H9_9HELO|nr:P-loop containing nucleoside triphosphate hydrolase protein [Amylocarpus encephaloides]